LTCSAWLASYGRINLRKLLYFVIPFSVTTEFMQLLTHSRSTDPFDIVTNVVGISAGLFFCMLLEHGIKGISNN
jgi:glycopeptide antibiotics resistance protein